MPQLAKAGASLRYWGYAMQNAQRLLCNSTTLSLPKPLTRSLAFEMETWDEN
jgi:hypothetical protein